DEGPVAAAEIVNDHLTRGGLPEDAVVPADRLLCQPEVAIRPAADEELRLREDDGPRLLGGAAPFDESHVRGHGTGTPTPTRPSLPTLPAPHCNPQSEVIGAKKQRPQRASTHGNLCLGGGCHPGKPGFKPASYRGTHRQHRDERAGDRPRPGTG